MAELAACDTCREAVVADGDLVVHVRVGKVVGALGHGADKDANALRAVQAVDVAPHRLHLGVKAERHFAAVGRQVVRDRVLDDPKQLFLRVSRPDGEPVQQLHHQAGEALECTRDADGRRDLDQNIFRRQDVDLELASFVDRRIEEGEEALYPVSAQGHRLAGSGYAPQPQRGCVANLVGDVGPRIADVAVHLPHDTNVLVAVQERIFFVPVGGAHPVRRATLRGGTVGLEARIGKHNNQSPRILVRRCDGIMLLGDELGQSRGGERLGSYYGCGS